MTTELKTLCITQVLKQLEQALMEMDGEEIAVLYNSIMDTEIAYKGDSLFEEK